MPSMQEALVRVGLASEAEITRRCRVEAIDDMLGQFDKLVVSNATFILTIKELGWLMQPENKGKSHQDFIAHARAELLARI